MKRKSENESAEKTAVIYARYSSHAQKEESIEQQVEECTAFARQAGYEIIEVYADKAVTGKRETRVAFQRMLRDAEKRRFATIIAYKSNRLARNMLNALQLESKMEAFGVSILYAKEEFGNNAAGRFALRMMMNVNQFYSENMAEDILRGMHDNAINCKINNGRLPFGYGKGADGKYAIVPEEAEIVRSIYTKFLDGERFVEIANELNARGVKTRMGSTWNKSSFAAILTNERYIGIYSWADVRVENGIPPIIEKEIFYRVQERLKTKKHPQGRHHENSDYMLTGKLFCGKCGAYMAGMSGTSGTGAKHYYYACQQGRKGACDKKAARRDDVELMVAEYVKRFILQDDVICWIIDNLMEFQKNTFENQQMLTQRQRIADIERAMKNILDAIERGAYTDASRDRLLSLEAEKREMERAINEQTHSLHPLDEAQILHYLDSFKDGDVENKQFQKRLFNQFVSAVYLYDDELRIAFSGSKETATIPFSVVDNADELADSSVHLSSDMSHHTVQNPNPKTGSDFAYRSPLAME